MDNLIRPFIFVFSFWWLVLFFLFADISDFQSVLDYITGGAAAFLIGGIFGVLFSYLARHRVVHEDFVRRLAKKEAAPLGSSPDAGAFTTIGNLPGFGDLPPMANVPPDAAWVPQDLRNWWRWYESAHPSYAQALREAWAVIEAANLPAGPTGHGGATLTEHSWNVLRTLLRLKEIPPYRGITNKDGRITFPLLDKTRTEYRLSSEDPLAMLCAFAHDIGKVVSFVKDNDGRIVVVKDDHDTEGQRLVRRLPSWRVLDFDEYQRALICLGYYHKPSEVPRVAWIDDRARAILMLVHQVDEWTSELEGNSFYDKFIRNPLPRGTPVAEQNNKDEPQKTEAAPTQAPERADIEELRPEPINIPEVPEHHEEEIIDISKEPEAEQEPIKQYPSVSTESLDHISDTAELLDHISDAKIIDAVAGILLKSGALKGVISVDGVGFKYGSWVYLHVPRLEGAMKRALEDSPDPLFEPRYCEQQTQGQPSEFLKRIMLALSNMGALKQEHEGKYYGPTTSFFFLKKLGRNGEVLEEKEGRPYYIIARAYAFGRSVFNLPDIRREPVIDRAVMENNQLTEEESIERVRALMQAWTEPKTEIERKEEIKKANTEKMIKEFAANGVGLMPFEPSSLAFMGADDVQRVIVKLPDGETAYRVSALAERFSPPEVPYETIEVDGEPCWRILRTKNRNPRKKS